MNFLKNLFSKKDDDIAKKILEYIKNNKSLLDVKFKLNDDKEESYYYYYDKMSVIIVPHETELLGYPHPPTLYVDGNEIEASSGILYNIFLNLKKIYKKNSDLKKNDLRKKLFK